MRTGCAAARVAETLALLRALTHQATAGSQPVAAAVAAPRGVVLAVDEVLALQKTAGNAAVCAAIGRRLLQRDLQPGNYRPGVLDNGRVTVATRVQFGRQTATLP